MSTEQAIRDTLTSSTLANRDGDAGNVVDALADLARAVRAAGEAVTPVACPGHDATGGTVASLTEAVMGVTAGLCRIASAISDLAEAVRETHGG